MSNTRVAVAVSLLVAMSLLWGTFKDSAHAVAISTITTSTRSPAVVVCPPPVTVIVYVNKIPTTNAPATTPAVAVKCSGIDCTVMSPTKGSTLWPLPCMALIEPFLPKPISLYVINKRQTKLTKFLLYLCEDAFPAQPFRRVYIDLGARHYHSSVGFFRRYYPQGKTFEVHAFEVDPKFRRIKLDGPNDVESPDDSYEKDKTVTFHNVAAWTGYGCIAMGGMKGFAGASYGTTFVKSNDTKVLTTAQCQALINKKPGMIGPVPTIDIAHFLSATLGLTAANSFVVMKVDIEGPEWVVMDHLRSAGALGLVKETMIECHWDTHGGPFKGIPLAECHRQQQRLRDAGVAAHEWY